MKLEQSFEVDAPIERVWDTLIDVQRVAPCLPGASLDEARDDGSYHGSFQVKLGPTTASYRGTLKMEHVDHDAHTVTMKASGQDKRGQGTASATMVSTLVSEGGGTKVSVDTDFTITGRLARFGRGGMIQDVSNRLMRDFAECLQETIGSEPAAGGAAAGGEAAGTAATQPAAGGEEAPAPAPMPPAPRPEAKPIKGFSLLFSVLRDRLRRLFAALRDRVRRLFSRRRSG